MTASLLWAFSFGLIKTRLAGIDSVEVATARLLLAALVFLPFLIRAPRRGRAMWGAMGLGAVQFGLMYILYIAAFGWLPAWMVALFTVFTPLYVALGFDLLDRRFNFRNMGAVLLAVTGALVVVLRGLPEGADWRGIVRKNRSPAAAAMRKLLPPVGTAIGGLWRISQIRCGATSTRCPAIFGIAPRRSTAIQTTCSFSV